MNKVFRVIFSLFLIFGLFLCIYISKILIYRYSATQKEHTIYNAKLADEYIDNLIIHHELLMNNNIKSYNWSKEDNPNDFLYYNGFVMLALLKTGKYDNFVKSFYNNIILPDGSINNNDNKHNRAAKGELDTLLVYYPLYFLKADKYTKAIDTAYKNLSEQITLPKCGNNYVHKTKSFLWDKYKFCLDGLYMALPFIARYKHDSATYNEVFNRMNWVSNNMALKNGLYSHGAKIDGIKNNVVWLRGAGWYALTQIELLDILPESKNKEIMKTQLVKFFDSMLKYQDKKTGMWKNVIFPKYYNKCNRFETSGTLMMAYSLLEAYNKGYVKDKKYLNAGLRAYNGVIDHHLKKTHGYKYRLKNIYITSNVKNFPKDYCKCYNYVTNEAKGIAPLIMSTKAIKDLYKYE